MLNLPLFHTVVADTTTNALAFALTTLIELGHLKHLRSKLGGSHDVIENLPIRLQCHRGGPGA